MVSVVLLVYSAVPLVPSWVQEFEALGHLFEADAAAAFVVVAFGVVGVDDVAGHLPILLEHGHATVNGGRTRAFPHWEEAEIQGVEQFEKELKEAIERES